MNILKDIRKRWREYVINAASDTAVERWNYWKNEYFRVEDENKALRAENKELHYALDVAMKRNEGV